jgi:DNA-binding NtrC family response regulator
MSCILIIDDNPGICTALEVLLGLHGLAVISAQSPETGLAALQGGAVELVIQDMNFSADTTSGDEGKALFAAIRERHPAMPVVLLTAWTDLAAAVELVKAGAADYLGKPWDDRKLVTTVQNLLALGAARRETAQLRQDRRQHRDRLSQYDLRGLVFASDAMERLLGTACQIARADVPVLISGPNGAGKGELAAIIQANSAVRDGPFVAVNCGALPSELIEAELFGAEAGAYTGAQRARDGRFEAADGGTLFLDEIGNLPPSGQMKLLRVLESGQFERLGSTRTRTVKVRVISATNADLPAMIRAGTFREDLYYRLQVIELAVAPLAERRDDVLPLAEHFVAQRATLTPAARQALLDHAWPGNVRELRNAIERAVLLCRGGSIEAADLALPTAPRPAARSAPEAQLDRASMERLIASHNGVLSRAAAELGLSRQALYRRMEKLGISERGA